MKTILIILTVLFFNAHCLIAQSLVANTCPLPASACLNTPYNGTIDLANPDFPHAIVNTPQRLSYAKTPLNPNFGM